MNLFYARGDYIRSLCLGQFNNQFSFSFFLPFDCRSKYPICNAKPTSLLTNCFMATDCLLFWISLFSESSPKMHQLELWFQWVPKEKYLARKQKRKQIQLSVNKQRFFFVYFGQMTSSSCAVSVPSSAPAMNGPLEWWANLPLTHNNNMNKNIFICLFMWHYLVSVCTSSRLN